VFATLSAGYPSAPGARDHLEALRAVVAAQEAAGLELLSDGRDDLPLPRREANRKGWVWPKGDSPVERWRRLAAVAGPERAKARLLGPSSTARLLAETSRAGRSGLLVELGEFLNGELRTLAASGCRFVQVDEPALCQLTAGTREAKEFVAAAQRLLQGVEAHVSLAVLGGSAEEAGPATLFDPPFQSYLLDLVDGPDNWRLAARAPGERGIIVGAMDPRRPAPDEREVLLWAVHYAASTGGRGLARVGLAPAGSLAPLGWETAGRKLRRLGEVVGLADLPAHELVRHLDPRAILRPPPRRRQRARAGDVAPPRSEPSEPTVVTTKWKRADHKEALMTRFWHGFADMHQVARSEVVFRRGERVWLEDTAGRRYLDATAALWYCNVGFGREAIARAVADQMTRLVAYSSFGRYTTEPTLQLAERLAALAPIPDAVVFLGSGGSDAVETAAKLVRRYWDLRGRPEKRLIVSREFGYHGMHAFGTELGGIAANRAGYGGPLVEGVEHVPAHDVDAVARLFEERGDEIAAFIGEPVIGAGGVYPPHDGYWSEIRHLCDVHDVLLIADEVITGFGRTGAWWGCQRYGFQPDLVTFAKGVTSGYMPLGGVLVGPRVRAPFWDEPIPGAVFLHGYTYSGHASACAAALANLAILEDEDLVGRVRALEPVLAREVGRLAHLPQVGEVRSVGLMAAVELAPDLVAADPGAPERVVAAALEEGIATRLLRGRAIHISPAFVISEDEIRLLVDGLGRALVRVGTSVGVA
jgi:putrescine aminotransferase